MRAFMRRHLGDPGLAPQALADHFRVSVRTVHKRFEQAETTFRQSLLAQRLEACRRALTEPRCDRMTVSQIAFGFGFSDLSHFTKAFRARYGTPPGRFRVEAARLRKGGAPDPGFPLARK
jgi:AraC-like DNA-binding protein